jgi:hypothetical protein
MKSDTMDEHLLGYLLKTLDPVTQQRVESYLRTHPDARARLELLEQALEPLAEDEAEAPPADLVFRTMARVSEYHCALPAAPKPTPHQRNTSPRRWARPVDWAVAAVLLLLVGGVLTPLIARQRQMQQRLACENNLRKFWVGLEAYADRSNNAFPQVEADGPRAVAGIFVPLLTDCGLAEDVSVECPARGERPPSGYRVKDLEQLHRASPADYRAAAHDLAGHYAYCLGYQDGQSHHGLARGSGDGLPILADSSTEEGGNSGNHGGGGQNVLYVGGNVRWCVQPTVGLEGDNIYVNRHNRVRAGVCRTDTVLAPSEVQPYHE